MKNTIFGAITVFLSLLLLAVGGEIGFRAYHLAKSSLTQNSFQILAIDDELGWRPAASYRFSGERVDASGHPYHVDIQTNELGFRQYGDAGTHSKKKVLFIGDSYTYAMQVSNDKTYYGILGNALPIEVFALGVDGYGTLQEYMVLNKYIDLINPDIIVLQFCPNDIINNLYEIELKSALNNNGMSRPYFIEERVEYKLPRSYPGIRDFANRHSRFLYFVISKLDHLNAGSSVTIEREFEQTGANHPLFKKSVEVTDKLIARIRNRVPSDIPIYAFLTDEFEPYDSAFRVIAERHGINFVAGITSRMTDAENSGLTTKAEDKAHWNELGHQIVADTLQASLQKEVQNAH